jgi:hypothetical protein
VTDNDMVETTPRYQVIAKIAISVVIGLIAFAVSAALDSRLGTSTLVGLGTSIFVGGVAFITQFLIDVDHRVHFLGRALGKLQHGYASHIDETREVIKNEFTKINEATQLFGLVEASALKTDAMTQLVKNSTFIPKEPSLIFDFAQSEINRLSGYLKELGQGGDVTYEGEDRDWLLGLTRVATSTVDATSLTTVDAGGRGFVDGGLWTSDLGQQYLEAQREAIRRDVKIRRIFIIDRPGLQNDDPDFTSILRQHAAIGVEVRTLRPNDMTPTRRASLFDFIVFDGVLSYQATIASRTVEQARPIIITTTLVTNTARVQERIDRFKDLWESAQPFPGASS